MQVLITFPNMVMFTSWINYIWMDKLYILNKMTLLPILLAAVYLGTWNCSSKIIHGSFFLQIAASTFVKFERNL